MTERPDLSELRRLLLDTGVMSPDWEPEFRAVPRSGFLPDVMWPFSADTGHSVGVDRRTDPDAWCRWAGADVPITIQWDDGQHTGPGIGDVYTSSCSMPSMVFSMLADLDVHPGMRVLEIGTGTGWVAALLAARLGDDHVTTIEVDPVVAEQARAWLHASGRYPRVVEGDGLRGDPEGAPYDRIVVTCGIRRISPEWVKQTRPGGIILVPWGTDYSPRDALARLVGGDGTASGRFTRPAQFMKARSQRLAWPRHEEYLRDWPGDVSATYARRAAVFSDDPYGTVEFAVGLLVPDCVHTVHDQGDGVHAAWFYGLTDRSWALARFTDGDHQAEVHQGGPRRLWDEVEAAWRWWDGQGRPDLERFGLTVTDKGAQRVWLDSPEGVLPGW